jgi:MFS family permease
MEVMREGPGGADSRPATTKQENMAISRDNRLAATFVLRALRHRNYRLFFLGQGLSLVGTWMQQVAMSWLVYRLTGSALMLGLIGFAGQIPTFLLASFAGVLADRWNRRHMLLLTQILSMVQAGVLTFFTYFEGVSAAHLIGLAIFLGIVNAGDIPARQALVVDIIEDRKDLGNAIALNSLMFNSARLIGPTIAGVVISATGEAFCFLLNTLSFFAVILALLAMQGTGHRGIQSESVLENLKRGYRYAYGFPPIRYILLLLALISLTSMPYVVLMPLFAARVLGGGAHTLGFLMGASGVGALISATYLASRKTVLGLGKRIAVSTILFGCALVAFSFSRDLILSLALMPLAGFGMMTAMAGSNTIIQTVVDEEMRGRVMSFYTMAFMGTAPLGSLLAGSIATRLGAPYTVGVSGLVTVVAGLLFYLELPLIRRFARPVYVERGVIAEMPSELQ